VKKIGISYLRFSSAEQKFGNSTERQLGIFADWCARNDLVPDLNASIADEGLSAYKGYHVTEGALGIFLGAVKDGKFPNHVLVAENLDRISRQGPKIARKIIEKIVDNGVDIHICNINVKLNPGWENDPAKSIIVDVELGRAWKESVYKSERIIAAWATKKSNAENGKALTKWVPAWLKAEKGEKIQVIPERAAIIVKIFELSALGLGACRIIDKLIADGDQPFGDSWTLPYIKKILKNRAVLGEFQPGKRVNRKKLKDGDPIVGLFPVVITHEQWNAARQSVATRTHKYLNSKTGEIMAGWRGGRSGNGTTLFTGLLFDATFDGRPMSFQKAKGDAKYDYLITAYKAGLPQHALRYDRFENAFLSFLQDLDWKSVAGIGESPEVKALGDQLEATLAEIDLRSRKISQMEKIVEEGTLSASLFVSLDAEKSKLVEAVTRKEKITSEVARARSKLQALYSPEALKEAIKAGKNPELRLKLKNEIAKRVSRIDIEFKDRKPVRAVITMINAYKSFILFQ
jgi:hypothetical protein